MITESKIMRVLCQCGSRVKFVVPVNKKNYKLSKRCPNCGRIVTLVLSK